MTTLTQYYLKLSMTPLLQKKTKSIGQQQNFSSITGANHYIYDNTKNKTSFEETFGLGVCLKHPEPLNPLHP